MDSVQHSVPVMNRSLSQTIKGPVFSLFRVLSLYLFESVVVLSTEQDSDLVSLTYYRLSAVGNHCNKGHVLK
jgi:hypothetical protein